VHDREQPTQIEAFQDDTTKMKATMIAAAARQRLMNLSSRAVKSRSAMVPLPSDVNDTMDGRGKNHTAQE
jgi:hypothetical protein